MTESFSPSNGLDAPIKSIRGSALPISFAVALLLALVFFYYPFICERQNFFYTDTTFFLKPEADYLNRSVGLLRFPLWNSYNYCGMPQIAVTFPTLFYFVDWLLILFPFSVGLALSMIVHQVLAACGIYALMKSFNYTDWSAGLSALIYSLCGYSFCLVNNHSLIAGTAWFVLSLTATRLIELDNGWSKYWKMIFGAFSISSLLLSGRPEIIAPSLFFIVVFVTARAIQRRLKFGTSLLGTVTQWQLRALFLGACFAMPQLLPVGEWLAVSRRASGLQLGELFLYSANWYDIISMVIGPALGDLRLHAAEFRPLVEYANLPPYISCAYLGPFAITLSLWGAVDSKWKYRFMAILALIISVLVSLGNNTIVLPWLIKFLPALGVVRFPIKWLFLAVFFVSILAARGLTALSQGRAASRFSALFWIVFAAFFLGFLFASEHGALLLPFFQTSLQPSVYLKAQRLIALSGLTTALIGLAISVAALVMRKLDPEDKALPITLVLLTSASLLLSAFSLERVGAPADFWSQPSYAADQIRALEEQDRLSENSRVLNLCLERFTVPPSYFKGDSKIDTELEYQYDRQVLKPNCNIGFRIPETLGFEGTVPGDFIHTALHCYLMSDQSSRPEIAIPSGFPLSKFCSITSTQYIITQRFRTIGKRVDVPLLDSQYFQLRHESELMNVRIYSVRKTLPHCYLANVCKLTENHNQVLESIIGAASDFDPSQITYIEGSQPNANVQSFFQLEKKLQLSHLKDVHPTSIAIEQPEHVRIETNSNCPTTLVLTDQSYAGWVATLDGIKVPILIANGFMRAVEIPTAGNHIVDFSYQPESLKLGLMIFGLGVFLALYLGFREFKNERLPTE